MRSFSFIFILLLFAGAGRARPLIVTTHTVLADFAQNVGGELVAVECILPNNVDPHSYEPKPADVRRLAKADLVIVNGLGLEPWATRLIENSGFRGRVVEASQRIPRKLPLLDRHDEGPATIDPHAWQNPLNAIAYVESISDALCGIDPANTKQYRANATAYEEQLKALDLEAAARFSALPANRRKLVTSHDALQYLADRYGLEIVPIAAAQPEREPSARELAAIITRIRELGIHAVFFEPTSSPKLAETVARETKARVFSELYTDSLGPKDSGADTYLGMFKSNIDVITRALK